MVGGQQLIWWVGLLRGADLADSLEIDKEGW
jgi:hypothetical protein